MARLPRLVVPGQPHHLIQRGTNQQTLFRDGKDYERMLTIISGYSQRFEVDLHAYVLMGNHFHLVATPAAASGLSLFMQAIGRNYVRYFNIANGRAGALWQGRYKGTVIDSERYLFTCMAYVELNPVRAGLASHPGDYPWSSYAHNSGRRVDSMIREHPLYWQLGNTPFAREAAYRTIVDDGVAAVQAERIVDATLKGWALMEPARANELLPAPTRRYLPRRRGRPNNSVPIKSSFGS
ncbi:MAG: transposase [Burkholderiales bacterium]